LTSKERRSQIGKLLISSKEPQKGNDLAKKFQVTRQVIVKDIAILRASGANIIATPDGYIIYENQDYKVRRVIAVNHTRQEMRHELLIVIRYGGTIEDVIVEHPVYGEIKAMLMIKNINDLDNFLQKFSEHNAEPLSLLTGGIHLHTIAAESHEDMKKIMVELENNKLLVT